MDTQRQGVIRRPTHTSGFSQETHGTDAVQPRHATSNHRGSATGVFALRIGHSGLTCVWVNENFIEKNNMRKKVFCNVFVTNFVN